jgi:hypothetical protein
VTGTWGSPNLPSGRDDFTARQQPDPAPVDDLSRFVLARIREAETEPRADGIPQNHHQHPMAYRYAGYVREDMVAFRHIANQYVRDLSHWTRLVDDGKERENPAEAGRFAASLSAMLAVGRRWSQHHDFQEKWRLE